MIGVLAVGKCFESCDTVLVSFAFSYDFSIRVSDSERGVRDRLSCCDIGLGHFKSTSTGVLHLCLNDFSVDFDFKRIFSLVNDVTIGRIVLLVCVLAVGEFLKLSHAVFVCSAFSDYLTFGVSDLEGGVRNGFSSRNVGLCHFKRTSADIGHFGFDNSIIRIDSERVFILVNDVAIRSIEFLIGVTANEEFEGCNTVFVSVAFYNYFSI